VRIEDLLASYAAEHPVRGGDSSNVVSGTFR